MRALLVAWLLWPALALAQAEPAPPDYVPPPPDAPAEPGTPAPSPPAEPAWPEPNGAPLPPPGEPPPKWRLAVAPRLGVLLAQGPSGLPQIGYGAGVSAARALVPLGRLRFGVGLDVAYDRFYRDKPAPDAGTQFLSHATFAAVALLDAVAGRFRPFLGVGGGLSVAAYEDPSSRGGVPSVSRVEVLGLVHLTGGLGVRVYESFELGLHGEVNLTFSNFQAGTPPRDVFQPGLFALGLDIGFRF